MASSAQNSAATTVSSFFLKDHIYKYAYSMYSPIWQERVVYDKKTEERSLKLRTSQPASEALRSSKRSRITDG